MLNFLFLSDSHRGTVFDLLLSWKQIVYMYFKINHLKMFLKKKKIVPAKWMLGFRTTYRRVQDQYISLLEPIIDI